ncbi:squalene-associated FAD-dependent desaturase [Iodobacter fluviatilis]|uniref:15-cis-phytoene desaturase n=2 Tax=Iodobacter fluviatilis TaxID=537 RepID=A0A377QA26_9NEIS|nr:squalene-associated FAD-dependent desaturase [Iodobacter fluviatilis]STQ91677.1 15-cis-phytoene desaturase [Iodobacter fluviatilis]
MAGMENVVAVLKQYSVAVLGAGYAGMTAATELAAAGVHVSVFEAGKVLGGRARKVGLEGKSLDNGQHLVIGAYTGLLEMMTKVGADSQAGFLRRPMELQVEPGFRLACPKLPAPLHLAFGLLFAKGLSWSERFALVRTIRVAQAAKWRLAEDLTVSAWLKEQRQPDVLISRFWQPLTVAALNTPLEQASAQVLLNVLRDSLGGARAASDLLLPRLDFSALYPDAAARFIEQKGGHVYRSRRVRRVEKVAQGWQLNGENEVFDAVICALPPHGLSALQVSVPNVLPLQVRGWTYQPIVTVYLQYAPDVQLPKPMLGLSDSMAQWVFDRGYTHNTAGLIAVVISAEGQHQALAQNELARLLIQELHQRLALPKDALWYRVITEKRATFACTPDLQRPGNQTCAAGFWLAGDYTAGLAGKGDYPATLEGAVRSGKAAAEGLLQELTNKL